jgi:hypothetical protein
MRQTPTERVGANPNAVAGALNYLSTTTSRYVSRRDTDAGDERCERGSRRFGSGRLAEEAIPSDVRALIAEHIDSVAQLEALLLMQAAGPGSGDWDAEALGRELRINRDWAASQLQHLCAHGLLDCDSPPAGTRFRYAPKTPELAAAVEGLARAYAERRVSVIGLIFSKPIDKIRSFADAFRLRKDPPPPEKPDA